MSKRKGATVIKICNGCKYLDWWHNFGISYYGRCKKAKSKFPDEEYAWGDRLFITKDRGQPIEMPDWCPMEKEGKDENKSEKMDK